MGEKIGSSGEIATTHLNTYKRASFQQRSCSLQSNPSARCPFALAFCLRSAEPFNSNSCVACDRNDALLTSFTLNTRQNCVKHLQVQLTGTSTAVPEIFKPMVKCGRFVVLGGPVWRRCLPDMRKVLNLEPLWCTNSVLFKRGVQRVSQGTW